MSAEGAIATVEHGGFTISSNQGTAESIAESLKLGEEPAPKEGDDKPDLSKAASELGKKGAEAAAKARKAKPKDEDGAPAKEGKEAAPKAEKQPEPGEEPEEEPAPEAAKDSKKGNPRHDPQARVAQATREAAEARREAAELRSRLEALERERRQPPPAPPAGGEERRAAVEQDAPPAEDAEPREEDFEAYRDYVKAVARWQYRQEARAAERQRYAHRMAAAEAQRLQQTIDGFRSAWDAATKADPEFPSKVSREVGTLMPSRELPEGQRPNGANWIADDFLSAPELAPALMLHLSEHPDEFQRIAALSSPRAVTRELAKIHARLDAATTGPSTEREVSRANPPVTPVTGSPAVASGNDTPKPGEDFDSWLRRTGNSPKR